MITNRFMLYLLGIFICTILLVIFLQNNSSRNIDQLITGNESLLAKYKLKNELQHLLSDLRYIIDADEKLTTGNSSTDVSAINEKKKEIAAELNEIKKLPLPDSTKKYVNELEGIINQLLVVLNKDLADLDKTALNTRDKGSKQQLALQAIQLAEQMNSSSDEHLAMLVKQADRNGQQAKKWGTILAAVTVLATIFAFYYITRRIKLQQQLIKQLNESEQKVREAASIKEKFMANMSHEIRTPMNAILGFTHLLQKQDLDNNSKEFVRSVQKSGENLLTIINDVLDFSKIEAGMMRIESNPFSLRGLLHSVETMFAQKAQAKNINLTVDVDECIPDVLNGDAVRLTQIMVNLVNNALKFTSFGEIDIRVTAREQTEDNVVLALSVKDTGIGIPGNKIDTIFERFQQAEEDTTRKYGGTGLGLSIVKQLVELQGGSISVNSVPNKGTEFCITIPYTITRDITVLNKLEYLPDDKIPIIENDVPILVVEDNLMNQNLMRHLLTDWNLNFHIVNNGREAIEALQKRKFSLVLMDIQMPEMDGYMATGKIRHELHSTIPIIAMTAHAMAGEREKCLSYGMNEYISKPIRENELFRIVNKLLRAERSPKEVKKVTNGDINNFEVIDPGYLQQLSFGNKAFEADMLEQFMQQIPEELAALKNEFDNNNYVQVGKTAHNLKTSVSFLGLLEKIGDTLDYIETNAPLQNKRLYVGEQIGHVYSICNKALQEAEAYKKMIV